MLDLSPLKNLTYYVVGLGVSGRAAVHALAAVNANVYAYDDELPAALASLPETVHYMDPQDVPWHELDAMVLSPGIPHTYPHPHKAAELAHQHGVPIICDVDLLAACYQDNVYIGITGTNGKSTTTALLHHLIPQAKCAGNIGVPVCELTDVRAGDPLLLELSSYQLERVPHLSCDIAVILNITADHLDRHGSMSGYSEAKRQIIRPAGVAQTVIIGLDTPETKNMYDDLKTDTAKVVIPLSTEVILEQGISLVQGVIFVNAQKMITLPRDLPLKGQHNHQNIAAAFAVQRALGHDFDLSSLASFRGLPHRLESVFNGQTLKIINDSKATNIDSTLRAIQAVYRQDHNLILLLGGIPKETGLTGLDRYRDHLTHCFVYGTAQASFSAYLQAHDMPFTACTDLESSLQSVFDLIRHQLPSQKTTLLFSPACASFDDFKNFEERGVSFKKMIRSFVQKEGL